jgi:hypothetical protein
MRHDLPSVVEMLDDLLNGSGIQIGGVGDLLTIEVAFVIQLDENLASVFRECFITSHGRDR